MIEDDAIESIIEEYTMEAGCRHTVTAVTCLQMVEVQLGKEISVHDKQKYPLG